MVFVETIPVTSTGKIQRREVRKALLAGDAVGA
jgi:acyl-coenzyme A synthetase/AMP-(fatty) acid ligase